MGRFRELTRHSRGGLLAVAGRGEPWREAPLLRVLRSQAHGDLLVSPEQGGSHRARTWPWPLFHCQASASWAPSLRGSPHPGVPHSTDGCGHAEWEMWWRRPAATPATDTKTGACQRAGAAGAAGHLSAGPALRLPQLQLAPQVEHAARGPGQLLGQCVVGALHALQLFPQEGVHL